MDNERTKALYEAFPVLYRGWKEPRHSSRFAASGIECQAGWDDLIWQLSRDLTQMATDEGRSEADWPKVKQVKEKFGGLRFYASPLSEAMQHRVADAEEA